MAGQNLRDRSRGGQVARRDNGGGEVDTTQQTRELREQMTKMQDQFQAAMPKGVEAQQLIRDAMTAVRAVPKLLECDPQSLMGSLMTCAQLGLRVGVLGQAWILPFYDWRSRGQKAQLIVGYQGLVELAHRSNRIESLIARPVHERDEFDVAYGLDDYLTHKPYRGPEGRGDITDYYAIVKLTAGGHAFIHMTKHEAEKHRDAHAMARKNPGKPNEEIVGPWRDDFDSMALKTCVIKLAKWMPKSTELARAIAADESVRFDTNPTRQVEDGVIHHYRDGVVIDAVATESGPDDPQDPGEPPEQPQEPDDGLGSLRADVYAAAQVLGLDAWAAEEKFTANTGVPISRGNAAQLDDYLGWLKNEAQGAAAREADAAK
jgi:recombination protein RecT